METSIFKSNDLKITKSRRLVLRVLDEAQLPMTAEQIYAQVSKEVRTSISTTYRTLATLSEKGLLLKTLSLDGKMYFQRNSNRHRHYLLCTVCSKVTPISGCPLHEWEAQVARETGYVITAHNLEFVGVCPDCTAQHDAAPN